MINYLFRANLFHKEDSKFDEKISEYVNEGVTNVRKVKRLLKLKGDDVWEEELRRYQSLSMKES